MLGVKTPQELPGVLSPGIWLFNVNGADVDNFNVSVYPVLEITGVKFHRAAQAQEEATLNPAYQNEFTSHIIPLSCVPFVTVA